MIKRIGIFCATTFLAAILSVLLLALMTNAQTRDLGAIKGQVRDAQGGAIADAAVKLTNKGSGLERTAKTDLHGGFNFDGLPLTGLYTLTVTAANLDRKSTRLNSSHL